MAVLTTIRHPNIVRVYACLTDMVEEAGALPRPQHPEHTYTAFCWIQCSKPSVCSVLVTHMPAQQVYDQSNLFTLCITHALWYVSTTKSLLLLIQSAAAPDAPPSPDGVNRKFRPVRAGGQAAEGLSSLCNIVVMEVCDRGNLRQAMRKGLLHKRTANKGLVVDMRLLVTVSCLFCLRM